MSDLIFLLLFQTWGDDAPDHHCEGGYDIRVTGNDDDESWLKPLLSEPGDDNADNGGDQASPPVSYPL